jgi:hypothetical protein
MNSIKTNKSLRILKDEQSLKGNSFVDIKTASDWIYDSKNAPIPKELIIYKSNLRAQLLTIEG